MEKNKMIIDLVKNNKANKLNLSILNLTSEELEEICDVLKINNSVEAIFIKTNIKKVIKSINQDYINFLFIDNTSLHECSDYNEDFSSICEFVSINKSIKTLSLKHFFFKNDLKIFTDSIISNSNSNIIRLILNNNKIDYISIKYINELLESNTKIKRLELNSNEIGDEGLDILSSLKYISLDELELCNNNISTINPNLFFNLKFLNLSMNKLDNYAIDIISEVISENPNLIELKLSKNYFTEIDSLSKSLKENKILKTLDISFNRLENNIIRDLNLISLNIEKTGLIIDNIINNTSLIEIDIGSNKYNHLISNWVLCCNLKRLCLYNNMMGDDHFVKLASSLFNNTTIEELDLESNDLSVKSAILIGQILNKNKIILEINLMDNRIRNDGLKYITNALYFNNTLEYINLKENGINDFEEIIEISNVNKEIKIDI